MKQRKIVTAVSLALSLAHQTAHAQFDAELNLSDLDGQNGFVINGVTAGDQSGRSVSAAGDVNGDGIDDVIVGANRADPNGNFDAGSSYVVFGSDSGLPNPLNLSDINGLNGSVINGVDAGDSSGYSVSAAGDVNGDGIDDVIVGALFADPNGNSYAGSTYVVFGSSLGLSNPLNLTNINGSNGFVINGVNADDRSGASVSTAGDVNGDGIDDVIIGAYFADPNGNMNAGNSYVVFGSTTGFPNPLNLTGIDGLNGFVINGEEVNDFLGFSVSAAGDVNGDGMDDVIIGAAGANPNGNSQAGKAYVLFGSESGLPNPFNLSSINGINGFVINGVNSNDLSGFSVSAAGDFNGDGFEDVIVGANRADPNGNSYAGSAYVVFGSASSFPNPLNLSSIDGLNGFVINGVNVRDYSGVSVSSAGDVNGDGMDDVIIGAFGADPNANSLAGSSYVLFGWDSRPPNPFNLSNIDGSNGFVINGVNVGDRSGRSVSAAGDVNGDGIDDVIVGAYEADPNGNNGAGSSYVVFGNDGIFNDDFE